MRASEKNPLSSAKKTLVTRRSEGQRLWGILGPRFFILQILAASRDRVEMGLVVPEFGAAVISLSRRGHSLLGMFSFPCDATVVCFRRGVDHESLAADIVHHQRSHRLWVSSRLAEVDSFGVELQIPSFPEICLLVTPRACATKIVVKAPGEVLLLRDELLWPSLTHAYESPSQCQTCEHFSGVRCNQPADCPRFSQFLAWLYRHRVPGEERGRES